MNECDTVCRFLDLSFNHISTIEHLDGPVGLNKLFLIQNKLSKIENLGHLTNLTMLELGSNRIRVSDVHTLDTLTTSLVTGHRGTRHIGQPGEPVHWEKQDYQTGGK